jgi:tetratricopeptide (TPR) repeat protein
MNRKDDLERQIRESYDIIREYEEIIQFSDRPDEVQRARHEIEDQWEKLREPLVQYLALCRRRNLAVPEEIGEIAATFGPELEEAVAAYRPISLRLPSGRRWIYGVVAMAMLLVGAIVVLITQLVGPAATPEPSPTPTTPPPTETVAPTATSTPLPPSSTPTPTPIFGQGALYRVAISQFDARHDTRPVEIAQRLEDDLRANLRTSGLADDVEVKVVPDVIGTEDQAQDFVSAVESDVLVWGWYDALGIRLYVLLGEGTQAGAPNVTGLHELPLGAANETSELSFYVHDVLPSNTTFLSMFVIGHLYYLSNNYAEGHKAFDAAMANIPETVALENEALLHFFNARLMQTTTFTDPSMLSWKGPSPIDPLPIICEYARAIELDPNLFEAYNNLGVLVMHVGGYADYDLFYTSSPYEQESCVQDAGISSLRPTDLFSQALQIRPDWALTWYNLAVLHWNVNETREESQAEFETLLELDPTIPGAHIALGNLAVLDGDFDTAVDRFATALELWPGSSRVTVNLGQALALAGRDEEAIAAYRQAMALDPNDAEAHLEAHLMLGNLYHRQGNLPRVYEEYQQAQQYSSQLYERDPCELALALAKYDIDTGAWLSATHRIASSCLYLNLSPYLLWLIGTAQGDSEADQYKPTETFCQAIGGLLGAWTHGNIDSITWCDLVGWCAASYMDDVSTWGSEANPCLPTDLEERLETVYAQFQLRLHYRLFFNQMLVTGLGACPYVFTYNSQHQGWFPDTTILYKLIGPEAEQFQARPLTRFDGRLWLCELEPEASYIDRLYVHVLTVNGRWLTLTSGDSRLAADDGDYLILHQGDERLLEFDLPPGALPAQQAWVVAEGYYLPYGEEK